MTNENLAAWFEECRLARDITLEQVRLWESWAEIERAAHQKLKGKVK